jgi:hypothetical protein
VYEVGGDAEIDITDLAEARLYRNFADEPTGISFALAAGRSPAVSLTIVWEE